MDEQSCNPTAFEYQSTVAVCLAELQTVARDLLHCRLILDRLTSGNGVDSDALWLAALVFYQRAFRGGARPGFSREQVASIGLDALLLHDRMLGEAQRMCSQSRKAFAETKIAAVIQGNIITAVAAFPMKIRELDNQIIEPCISMVEALSDGIIAPQVANLEKSILQEMQTLGIQLVRYLPRVDARQHAWLGRPHAYFLEDL